MSSPWDQPPGPRLLKPLSLNDLMPVGKSSTRVRTEASAFWLAVVFNQAFFSSPAWFDAR